MTSTVDPAVKTDNPDEIVKLTEAQSRSKLAWKRLWLQLSGLDPIDVLRLLLAIGALVTIIWLLHLSWSSLLPFQIGIVLAYIMSPLVNRLQRHMPRWTAILIVILIFLLILFLVIAFLIPPLIGQLSNLLQSLPDSEQLQQYMAALSNYLDKLPTEYRQVIDDGINDALISLRSNVLGYVRGLISLGINAVLSVVNTFTFLLGFVVIPFWLFFVLIDIEPGKKAVNQMIPAQLRTDFWSVLTIINRVIGSYFRGQLILGTVIFFAVFIGLTFLEWIGIEGIRFKLLLAVFAGFMELIPFIGPILGSIPAIIVGLFHSWETGLAIALLFLVIQQLEGNILVPRVVGDSVSIHPAIVMMLVIVLAPFGLIWLIVAVPVVAIIRDIYLYIYGRLSKPPLPAGHMPRTPIIESNVPAARAEMAASDELVPGADQPERKGVVD
ncbi:MAG: AI-2E family transporter [Anaerolineae bacterium]|nr:AI-2E family transporter [Anaerolineae bacterium]MCB0180261.1 AI-2E family transporter [Anaerolineae bacterium]MCB0223151.1 AI-2E family transporter [Anaerolineae bacterium]MCB9109533.1 AI-2E family transporter [Anaerolineales bacterium]